MISTEFELNRYRTEMAMAERVQAKLLAGPAPEIAGLDIAAVHRPGFHVGGDFYDFFLDIGQDETRKAFTFIVSDICGSGISAALMVGMTRLALRMGVNHRRTKPGGRSEPRWRKERRKSGLTPEEIFSRANAVLYEDFSRTATFATAFIGRYEMATRTLTYANAGHSPVIFIPAGGKATLLIADGAPIGVLPISAARNHHQQLGAGDLVLVGTDGLAEAYAGCGNLWTGYQRLLRKAEELTDRPAKVIADTLFNPPVQTATPGDFEQTDDQILVIIKCT